MDRALEDHKYPVSQLYLSQSRQSEMERVLFELCGILYDAALNSKRNEFVPVQQ